MILRKTLPIWLRKYLQEKIGRYRRRHRYAILYKNNKRQIEKVLSHLTDDESRKTLLAYMKLRMKESKAALLRLTNDKEKRYFDETIIHLGEDEVFVDMGVYDGATSLEFAKRTEYKYDGILLFEPDLKNFTISKENIATLNNAVIWNEACYDQDRVIDFNGNGKGSARISDEETGMIVQAVKLDSKLKTISYKPTFIKMDIEGAEAAALRGASDTIRQMKPKLAVCLYHKPQDIWELPLLLKEILPEYKLYIRHYDIRRWENDMTALFWDLVCYAVI